MKIGMICPYSFDVPGGVQFHMRDLARYLMEASNGEIDCRILAPAEPGTAVPDFVDRCGGAIPVPYNGSIARLNFGPVASAKVRRWLDRGDFDLVHLHEPQVPSLSLIGLQVAEAPIVATFHTSIVRSRALSVVYPMLRPSLERISARIAVSEDARRTLVEHLGGDAVVIPNGVVCEDFATAQPQDRFKGTPTAPTLAFLGRIDESRKGLAVLAGAWPRVHQVVPGARLLVAGRGDTDAAATLFTDDGGVEFLGEVSEQDKRALLASVDIYVAPQTGGESFGIVLVEAMAAGTCVVASDLGAFSRVLDHNVSGMLFRTGDSAALSGALLDLLRDDERRWRLSEAASVQARRFDWSRVAAKVLAVYDVVTPGLVPGQLTAAPPTSGLPMLRRLLG